MGAHITQTTRLAETLCARLCHDMASPLGTVAGALDLALEDPEAAEEALALAREAAGQMLQRLKLTRAAWAGDCGSLDAAGLAALAQGLPPRVRLDIQGLAGLFEPLVARVLVNMLLLAADALPRGGQISLTGAAGADVVMMVAGLKAAWPASLMLALANPEEAPLEDPRAIQGPLAALLAEQAGLRLSLLLASGPQQDGMAPLLLSAP